MEVQEATTLFRPKCVWCSADWSDDNIKVYDLDAGDHCDSGRFYAESCTVSISCHKCGKEMYRKEGVSF